MNSKLNFIERIVSWNQSRYDQDYDHKLAYDLLDEELIEFMVAIEDVDKLDALVDIVYIAIGAMWKLGLSPDQINEAIQVVCDSNDSKPARKTASHIKANIDKGASYVPPEPRLQAILADCS